MQTILEKTQTKLFFTVIVSIFVSFSGANCFYNSSILLILFSQILLHFGAKSFFDRFNGIIYENLLESKNQNMGNEAYQIEIDTYLRSKQKQDQESRIIILTGQLFGIILFGSYRIILGDYEQILKLYATFMITNVIFHIGEFMLVCFYHYDLLCWKSFMINHSPSYNIAFVCSQLEFWIKYLFFYSESNESHLLCAFLGISINVVGHFLRIGAFLNAKKNFQHLVQYEKEKNHVLVKSGLYSVIRHPSYLGFFLYSLGGQLIIQNYICFFAYFVVLWRFFYSRIFEEEFYLIKFFGQDYIDYRKKTGVFIPGIEFFLKRKRNQYYNIYKKEF